VLNNDHLRSKNIAVLAIIPERRKLLTPLPLPTPNEHLCFFITVGKMDFSNGFLISKNVTYVDNCLDPGRLNKRAMMVLISLT
jgi:hypothetical protein